MHETINKHKTPIAITSVGIVAAIGLAIAPLIMADSETDKLAQKNASEIQKLLTSMDSSSADVQEQMTSLLDNMQATLGTIESQIQILNKATTQINLRQNKLRKQISDPAGPIQSSINKQAQNSDGRLVNVEKAVSNLHRKQRALLSPSGQVQSSIDKLTSNSNGRLVNLEKAVTQLHHRQRNLLAATSSPEIPAENTDTTKFEQRLAALESTIIEQGNRDTQAASAMVQPPPVEPSSTIPDDFEWRVAILERTIREMAVDQKVSNSTENTRLTNLTKKDIQTSIKINDIEQSLAQLVNRLDYLENNQAPDGFSNSNTNRFNQPANVRPLNSRNNLGNYNGNNRNQGSYQPYDPVTIRLEDLRGTIDALINELSR